MCLPGYTILLMGKVDRLAYLAETLRQEGKVSIKDLKEKLCVSEATIRRDIQTFLKMTNLPVRRVHGGLLLDINKSSVEPLYEARLALMAEEKARIAAKALEYIDEGDSIILDSGTTSLCLARLLHNKSGLKVIATDIKLAEELARFSNVETYIIGGRVRTGYYTIGEFLAEEHIRQLTVEKVFLTADAIDPKIGITNASMFEVGVKKAIVAAGKTVILLADHSKLGKRALFKVCDLSDIDIFITSIGGDPELLKEIEQKVPQLVQV
jgi:DeoR family fructose operon transcriptional repressor